MNGTLNKKYFNKILAGYKGEISTSLSRYITGITLKINSAIAKRIIAVNAFPITAPIVNAIMRAPV
jgi:hypothetical protein